MEPMKEPVHKLEEPLNAGRKPAKAKGKQEGVGYTPVEPTGCKRLLLRSFFGLDVWGREPPKGSVLSG